MLRQFKYAEDILLGNTIAEGYQEQILSILKGKPFWIWDEQEHDEAYQQTGGLCCFNDIVGRPTKDKREFPLFDYEKLLYDTLMERCEDSSELSFKDKHLWCLKSTGLGVSEMFLRLMAWLCTKDDTYKNSQMCIVTGPNIDLATKLIKRLKAIFSNKLGIYFTNKKTVLELNGCMIEAYPSNHLDSFRSLTNPKFIFLDEADMFRKGEQEDVRHVSERYIGKSDPYIVMVSTPAGPGSLFYKIEAEPEDTCIYKRLKLDYTYGVGKIEIERAKHSPSFDREYRCQFSGFIGNVFSETQILKTIELGELYSLAKVPHNPYNITSIGCDVGFGSSNTAVVATEFLNEEAAIRVIYAQEWEHGDPQAIVNLIFNLYVNYGTDNTFIWVDGSNRAFCNLLKVTFNESLNWEKQHINPEVMRVLPVSFASEHKQMLSHLAMLASKSYLAIPKEFDKLIISLRTAYSTELSLDKERTSYSDSLDAYRLACKMYKIN